jgi:hypothetical protein
LINSFQERWNAVRAMHLSDLLSSVTRINAGGGDVERQSASTTQYLNGRCAVKLSLCDADDRDDSLKMLEEMLTERRLAAEVHVAIDDESTHR